MTSKTIRISVGFVQVLTRFSVSASVAVAMATGLGVVPSLHAVETFNAEIQTPRTGDSSLRIVSTNLLEVSLINTKSSASAPVSSWDWVNAQQQFVPPNLSTLKVTVNGQPVTISSSGFRRRPVYAPLLYWDLRIGNSLYLQLAGSVPEGARVEVSDTGSSGILAQPLTAVADPLRYSPAIHVNQEGYLPGYPKKAAVGYYLGSLGEMSVPSATFYVVNAATGARAYEGTLTSRPDVGYKYSPLPYQKVYEADFSALTTPGQYRLAVPGLGASFPFWIDDGIAMDFTRTYALGMFHQRSGFDVAMPFTRFTHAADHLAPAAIPTNNAPPFTFTWDTIADYSKEVSSDNPVQTAPGLTNPAAQLFPFVKQGTVTAPGGHFEAGDYNRVTYNGAQLVHVLMFAVDSMPGVAALDNLGLPESGDGISDALQEAKWEADFIAKMQDSDGGFYYSVYPRDREYEIDVLPENGDPEVVWPKNTATTAAAVAALAQCASSPRFRQAYPQVADSYRAKALLGWQFLTNAIARYGFDGSYQRIQHFDDYFTHSDDLVWAACELFLATGDPQFETKLMEWFPDPASPTTFRWGWRRLFASYGNAVRDYAFAVSSGRVTADKIRPAYLGRCIDVITNAANDLLFWSEANAYGTSLSDLAKAYRGGGWYFSTAQAFDLAVGYQLNPSPDYLDALLRNVNYEAGCNPVNVSYVTGLGWKRPRNVVDQYSLNDRRVLPKSGIPVSNIQQRFMPVWVYGWELGALTFPSDDADTAPYPYYDRWSDDWNVSTEGSTTDIAHSFATVAWLAAKTSAAARPFRSTQASINPSAPTTLPGQPVTVSVNTSEDLTGARIIWEAKGQEPVFDGASYTFVPGVTADSYWLEAEVQWPDGRRAFAASIVAVTTSAGPQLSNPRFVAGTLSFTLTGAPQTAYVIESSSDLATWKTVTTTTSSAEGQATITDSQPGSGQQRFYRAVRQQ